MLDDPHHEDAARLGGQLFEARVEHRAEALEVGELLDALVLGVAQVAGGQREPREVLASSCRRSRQR